MAVEETKEQQQMYDMFRIFIYVFVIMEFVVNLPITASDPVGNFILNLFRRVGFFNSVVGCKFIELTCVFITCLGSRPQKDLKFNMRKMVVYPMCIGFYLVILSIFVHHGEWGGIFLGTYTNRIIYAACSILGIMFIHQAGDSISKHMRTKLGDDRFNFENESFQQTKEEISNDYSVNIPMIFYFKNKMNTSTSLILSVELLYLVLPAQANRSASLILSSVNTQPRVSR